MIYAGIGIATTVILFQLNIYYIIVLAWDIYYLYMSMTSVLPWSHCNNSWNTDRYYCVASMVVSGGPAVGASQFFVHSQPNITGLPKFQINRLQHIQNDLARTIVQAPKFKHITPILKSLYWLKVSERIKYKVISLAYKILNTTQPSYLYDLVSIQPPHDHNTCSSPYVTLIKPSSSLKVTHRSFRHVSPHLWNQLPTSLRILYPDYSPFFQRHSFEHTGLTCCTLLSPSITFHCFTLSSRPTFSENLILHL